MKKARKISSKQSSKTKPAPTNIYKVITIVIIAVAILIILWSLLRIQSGVAGKAYQNAGMRQWTRCVDSDGGTRLVERGTVTAVYDGSGSKRTIYYTDACLDNTRLVENYCNGLVPTFATIPCKRGCAKGSCLE